MLFLIANETSGSVASLHESHTLVVYKECGRLIVAVVSGINDP
jgi:hypothetical protein